MRTGIVGALWLLAITTPIAAEGPAQTDWSGGPGTLGPVTAWGNVFESADSVSWLSFPGRAMLTANRTAPVERLISDAYMGCFGIYGEDMDDDGDVDFMGACDFSGRVSIWWNQGDSPPTFVEQAVDTLFGGAQTVHPADFDLDGDLDLCGDAADPGNAVVWWRNDGGAPIVWTRLVIDPAWTGGFEILADDVNLDGRPDVLCPSWDGGRIAWWRNDGGDPVVWTKQLVDTLIAGAHSVQTADFDGDGDVDLAGAGAVDNVVVWYRNDGGAPIVWTKQVIRTAFFGARSVDTGDFDRDGDPDLVGASWTSHLCYWRNDGGDPIVWTEQVLDLTWAGGHHVDVADIDGDGRLDVLSTAFDLADIKWWRNEGASGDTLLWTRNHIERNLAGAVKAMAVDLDGDGSNEVIGSSWTLGVFQWYEITDFRPDGVLTSSVLDTDGRAPLTGIEFAATTPAGTDLRFRVRASNDPGDLGAWSADITAPGAFPAPLGRYVQYEVRMATIDPEWTPILNEVRFLSDATSVDDAGVLPSPPSLRARPNPFNPETTLAFRLDRERRVKIGVYDPAGRRVALLADRFYPAGEHTVSWDGRGDRGPLPSGVYLVRLESGRDMETEKVVLLR